MSRTERVRVWPLSVRLLHAALVLGVATSWFTRESTGPWHLLSGTGLALLAALRLGMGLRSRWPTLRFDQFITGPQAVLGHVSQVLRGQPERHLGHNPLGGWMVLALLIQLLALALTGWLYQTDAFWGEAWLADLHAALGWTLLALIALHVAGVLLMSRLLHENLVRAMIDGFKRP